LACLKIELSYMFGSAWRREDIPAGCRVSRGCDCSFASFTTTRNRMVRPIDHRYSRWRTLLLRISIMQTQLVTGNYCIINSRTANVTLQPAGRAAAACFHRADHFSFPSLSHFLNRGRTAR